MDHFYKTLLSDRSRYYFTWNTVPNFRTKLATLIENNPDKWEVGQVEISCSRGYKKQPLRNILHMDSREIKFPLWHYTSLYDIFVNLKWHFRPPDEKDKTVIKFNGYLNKHVPPDGNVTNLLGVCYGQILLQTGEKLVFHFPVWVYNGLEDLAETIMNPTNCCSLWVNLPETDKSDFVTPEPVQVNAYITKLNLLGDTYVRLLTTLHFPSTTGYHRFLIPSVQTHRTINHRGNSHSVGYKVWQGCSVWRQQYSMHR